MQFRYRLNFEVVIIVFHCDLEIQSRSFPTGDEYMLEKNVLSKNNARGVYKHSARMFFNSLIRNDL
ncbi:hypothetical protein ACBO_04850 [Acinetobacter bouvetii]|nr:hypothetical protein ACBO_04850 [Acinetobacter bouvetii]